MMAAVPTCLRKTPHIEEVARRTAAQSSEPVLCYYKFRLRKTSEFWRWNVPDFSDLFVRLVFMGLSRPPPVKVL
jgi:hypothetical protein